MKHKVVNLVVSVHQRRTISGLRLFVLEEPHSLLKVRQLTHGLLGLDVDRLGLARADGGPRLDLAVVEPVRLAKRLQADLLVVDGVQPRQGMHGLSPQERPLLGAHPGHGKVLKDAPVEELHDVEGRADDALVLAEAVRLGHGDAGALQRMQHPELALDLVRRLGDELARGLLAHDEALAIGGDDLVGRVRLAKTKL